MSRDENHGGGDWAFRKCLWSPTRKKTGQKWAYWETVREIKAGDLVLHLRGDTGKTAEFIGWSSAIVDGEETSERPPSPGLQWEYSPSFYRARLGDYAALKEAVSLRDIFHRQEALLSDYFAQNKQRRDKLRLFYVRQSQRWQCQNGAYCSNLDADLVEILLGEALPDGGSGEASTAPMSQVTTAVRVRDKWQRFPRCWPYCALGRSTGTARRDRQRPVSLSVA